jgi:hypothetical protein
MFWTLYRLDRLAHRWRLPGRWLLCDALDLACGFGWRELAREKLERRRAHG